MVCTGRCAAWLCCGIVLRALQERALAEGGPGGEREREWEEEAAKKHAWLFAMQFSV
jgi:hypothetical protein